MKFKLLCW